MRFAVSSLSVGELGWIQIANFLITGSLILAFSVALRQILLGPSGSVWGPVLIGLVGVGLIGAGLFVTDPLNGYPPGTPLIPTERTTHGILHDLFGVVGAGEEDGVGHAGERGGTEALAAAVAGGAELVVARREAVVHVAGEGAVLDEDAAGGLVAFNKSHCERPTLRWGPDPERCAERFGRAGARGPMCELVGLGFEIPSKRE